MGFKSDNQRKAVMATLNKGNTNIDARSTLNKIKIQQSNRSSELFTEIGTKNFKNAIQRDIFVDFMKKRFPKEASPSYIQEWANRFKSGRQETYMDLHSSKVYEDVKVSHGLARSLPR